MTEQADESKVDNLIEVLNEDYNQDLFTFGDFLLTLKSIMSENFTDAFSGRFFEKLLIDVRRYQ